MKTTEYIKNKIDRFSKGYIFTYKYFINDVKNREAIIKSLNRMVASGKINKLSKGKFYKVEPTVFGDLLPKQTQIVRDLLEKNGKTIGYITGFSSYNELGLTTQISSTIQIGKNEIRTSFKRGVYKISFIKQKNTITKENIPLLKLLDAIRYIKKIPDGTIDFSCNRLMSIFKEIPNKKINLMIKLALKYPPSTRALLGAILENNKYEESTNVLKKSLNPITTYKLSVSKKVLPNIKNWNIQ